MAFTSTITKLQKWGDRTVSYGTYTNAGGDTGGDIRVGFNTVEFMKLTQTGSAVSTNEPVINETFPFTGNPTIVTDDDRDGLWWAIGR